MGKSVSVRPDMVPFFDELVLVQDYLMFAILTANVIVRHHIFIDRCVFVGRRDWLGVVGVDAGVGGVGSTTGAKTINALGSSRPKHDHEQWLGG